MKLSLKHVFIVLALVGGSSSKTVTPEWEALYLSELGHQNTWSAETLHDIAQDMHEYFNYLDLPEADRTHVILRDVCRSNPALFAAFGGSSTLNIKNVITFLLNQAFSVALATGLAEHPDFTVRYNHAVTRLSLY